jgi:hypothetical protein
LWPGPVWSQTRLVGDTGSLQALRIVDPSLGQVQLPVDQGVPGVTDIDQVDGDLGVLDPTGVPVYWRCTPTVWVPFFEIAGLVDDQHRLGVAKALDQVGAEVVADAVVVPHRPAEQMLHPIRAGVADVLGDRPAVLAWQVGQQPEHERPGPPAWLHPAEPARDPAQQPLQPCLPSGRVYAVACGHRLISGCPHNTGSSTVAALVCSPARPDRPDNDLRLEY